MPPSGLPAPHVPVSPQRPVLALLCLLSLAVPASPASPPCYSPCLLPAPGLTYMVSTGGWLCRSLGKACPRQPSGPNLGSLWKARHIPLGRPTPSVRKGIERWMKPPSTLGAHTQSFLPTQHVAWVQGVRAAAGLQGPLSGDVVCSPLPCPQHREEALISLLCRLRFNIEWKAPHKAKWNVAM